MTENKQFIFHKNDGEIEDTVTQEFHEVDVYRFDYMIVEKMNDLADENKELQKENEQLKALLMSYGELDGDEIEEELKRDRNEYNY